MISDGMAYSGKPFVDSENPGDPPPDAQRALTRAVGDASEQGALTPTNVDIVKATPTAPIPPRPEGDDELTPAPVTASLSERKQIAAHALARRKTIKEAAKLAGVDQRTVRRWIRNDAQFNAALNSLTMEIAQILNLRTHALASSAMDNLENAVDDGDMKASMFILAKVAEAKKALLPTTPEAVTEQMRLEACKLQLEIDRKREELWKIQLEIQMNRNERQRKLTPYSYRSTDPKINGTEPLDLPVKLKPDDDPAADGS